MSKTNNSPILVPVDFSDHSKAALKFAAKLCAQINAELIVLHVVHDPGNSPGFYNKGKKSGKGKDKSVTTLTDAAAEMMKDFMADMVSEYPNIDNLNKAETKLKSGLVVQSILKAIDKEDPLMVVMGSQGLTGISRLMIGSKAEQLVRLSPVPVTIVKIKK